MKINAINNQMFGAKKISAKDLSRIETVGKVNGYVEDMLCFGNKTLQEFAQGCNVMTKIAQKDKAIIVNSGPKTSVFNLGELKNGKEFYQNIMNNMKENGDILARM